MFSDLPYLLRSAEFSRVDFLLEFQELYGATAESVLRLRRDLHQAARLALGTGERFSFLFEPPLPSDPIALRRVQRPGPPFVLLPPTGLPRPVEAGDLFALSAIFWGDGRHFLGDFARALQALGRLGLHRGEGRFDLTGIEGEDAAGNRQLIWQRGERLDRMAAPVLTASWWLETGLAATDSLRLEFLTPARLLSAGRPLFRPTFARLFPFILRRVTSVLYAHCGLEMADDARALIARATEVEERENRLAWRDWRVLAGESGNLDLGGVGGSVQIDGATASDLLWVLGLGSLMNLGKGAAYGAGHYCLTADHSCEDLPRSAKIRT